MMLEAARRRREVARDTKRAAILAAAKKIFSAQGLEGASLRGIAEKAGFTPGAIYAYFASKEEIYAAILRDSGQDLRALLEAAEDDDPRQALRRKLATMYAFYRDRPRDLELGLYLARGIGPKGLTTALNRELNQQLIEVLALIGDEVKRIAPGMAAPRVKQFLASIYGSIIGCVILTHTRRLQILGAEAEPLMQTFIERTLAELDAAAGSQPNVLP